MAKRIRKAVFPVAGLGTRVLPATKAMPKEMLTIVDKPLIQYVLDEAKEAGIDHFVVTSWYGILVPAGTPAALVNKLNRDISASLLDPVVRGQISAQGADPVGSSPAEFAAFFRSEAAKWGDVAKRSGTKLD